MKHSRSSLAGLVLLVLGTGAANQWWAGRQQANLGSDLAALAKGGDIRMLSSRTCAYCTAARRWLQQHGVSFSECFIETDRACAADFEAARAAGTPLVLVRGQALLGFDAQRVFDTLRRAPAPG